MSVRFVWVTAALGLVMINGCQPQGLAPVTGDGGGGGDFVTPSPDPNLGAERVPASPDPAGVPVLLPPLTPPPASPVPSPLGGGGVGSSPGPGSGLSPAPFPAVSPPPSPGVGAAGGA